ncbi:MAG: tryptophan halogenase family protein [Aestuariibacter sp.]
MAANLFAKRFDQKTVQTTLIESPDIGIIGVGEGSTPTLKRFFESIDVPESRWMNACNATYKVSIQFEGWSPASGNDSYRHPFISQIDTFTQKAFEVNCRTRRMGLDTHTNPEDFLINGMLAKSHKGPVTPENFPFRMEYGYHFDSGLLGQFLRDVAVENGVEHLSQRIVDVSQHPDGQIKSLHSDNGDVFEGDFFVDCTGFNSLLLQKTLGIKFHSYKDNLFNDSAVVMPTAVDDAIPPETKSTALSSGWCWKIPLQNRYGNGYVYSSDYIDSDRAEQEFRAHLGMLDSDTECRHLKMKVGQVEQHWAKNCLAIGLSQGFIEPLEATALHLVQICLEMFIEKYQKGNFTAQHRDAFNGFAKERFDRVRDYIVAHYKLNTRDDSDYWRDNRENRHISASLSHVLDKWFRREDVTAEINRQNIAMHWDPISWHCLLSGYGAYPPLAPNQPGKGDLYQEQDISRFLQGCALNFQSHEQNLRALSE